jgi:Domain of unknown function (DUF4386)
MIRNAVFSRASRTACSRAENCRATAAAEDTSITESRPNPTRAASAWTWSFGCVPALAACTPAAGVMAQGRTGSILVNSVVDGPAFLADISSDHTVLALGAFLMIATTAVDIGKADLLFPVLEHLGKRTAVAYLATMIFEMALMTVRVLALLMIIPLADQADQLGHDAPRRSGRSRSTQTRRHTRSASSRSRSGGSSSALLLRTRLVSRWLAGLGLIGYALHMAGSGAELFGLPISLILLIPGALFEVTRAIWLLAKGFTPAAYDTAGATTF